MAGKYEIMDTIMAGKYNNGYHNGGKYEIMDTIMEGNLRLCIEQRTKCHLTMTV